MLTGALGMQDPDEDEVVALPVIAVHAVLLLAALGAGPARVHQELDLAIAEMTWHQTVEMP